MKLNDERLDAVFSALGHPHRRALVDRLSRRGECTVGELAEGFDVSLNQVSKHLKTLEAAGLLRRRRVGREHRCSLRAAPLARARTWLEHYERFWRDSLEGLARHLDDRSDTDADTDTNREENDG